MAFCHVCFTFSRYMAERPEYMRSRIKGMPLIKACFIGSRNENYIFTLKSYDFRVRLYDFTLKSYNLNVNI